MTAAGRRTVVLITLLVAIAGVVLAGAATAETAGPEREASGHTDQALADEAALADGPVVAQEAENNSSVRHKPQQELDEAGDGGALQQWLASRLSSQLGGSSVSAEQGDYEQAKEMLGDDYSEQLAKYVEVSGETDGASDDEAAEQLETATEKQQEYVSTLEQYRETHRKFREAKRNGNETRVRELARELNELADQLRRAEANLTASYETIANRTGTNLSQANRTVSNVTANVSAQQQTVRRETFTNTTLTITEWTENGSFRDPVRVAGNLTDANGTALADRRINVTLGNQSVRTTTGEDGRFNASIRPADAPAGRQSIVVEYEPRSSAGYLSSNDSEPVTVVQTSPTVTLTNHTSTAIFNETVTVRGRIGAADTNASHVPVALSIDGTILNTTRTADNGTFAFEVRLPAAISSDERSLSVSLPEKRALAPISRVEPIRIEPTATQITMQSLTQTDGEYVGLYGRLTTDSGTPLPNETVEIRVDGQTVGTATTNATGRYRTQIRNETLASARKSANGSVAVVAVYPGRGNLQSRQAQIPLNQIFGSDGWLPDPAWLAAGGLVALGALGVGLRRLGLDPLALVNLGSDEQTDSEMGAGSTEPTEPGSVSERDDSSPAVAALREQAGEQLAADRTESAVRTAYAAVRRQVTDTLGWSDRRAAARTYWEFHRACRESDAITDGQAAALERLTEQYERARFTTGSPDEEAGAEAVESAFDLLDAFGSASRQPGD
jgi:hypothetical protein